MKHPLVRQITNFYPITGWLSTSTIFVVRQADKSGALEINPNNSVAPQVLNYVKQMRDYQEKMKKYNEAKKNSQ